MVKQLSRPAAEEEEACPRQDESDDRAASLGGEGACPHECKKSQLDVRQQCDQY